MSPQTVEILVPLGSFVFGAIIGSFLNVVIFRLPRAAEGLTIARPRLSICPKCGTTIRGYDNLPLLSYFVLGGRCRACRAPISLRYFVVELLTACVFAYIATRYYPAFGLIGVYAALAAALIAVTFIDIDLRIIPDKIDIPGMVLAPALSALVPALHRHGAGPGGFTDLTTLGLEVANPHLASALSSGIGIVAGAGLIYVIGVLGALVFRKEAMGFGDVKLLGMIGGYVGWQGVLLALVLACLAGAAIGIVVKLATKDPYIPFGPFLSLGALLVVLWRADILELYAQFVHLLAGQYPRFVQGLAAFTGTLA